MLPNQRGVKVKEQKREQWRVRGGGEQHEVGQTEIIKENEKKKRK